MFLGVPLVVFLAIARSLGEFNGPTGFPIPKESDFCGNGGPQDRGELLQDFTALGDFLEGAGIFVAHMVHDRPMELLTAPLALPPLEIKIGVSAMGDGLQGGGLE